MASHFARCLWPLCLLAWIAPILGSTVHTVLVGASGSFFDPPTLSAAKNDMVSFFFSAGIHSVVQSNINAPCSPLPGGFSSGEIPETNLSMPRLSWDLLITDDTSPIYYFCAVTNLGSHCNAAMVGAINPPAIAVYNSWVSAAKLATGTPAFTATFAGTGIGAFASGTPSITSGAPTPSPPPPTPTPPASTTTSLTTSSTSTSTTPTPTFVAARTSISRGAIAGGVVAGLAALFIIVILSFLLYRRRIQTPRLLGEPSDGSMTKALAMRRPGDRSTSMPVRRPIPASPVQPIHSAARQTGNHLSDHPYEGQPAQSHGYSERQPHPYPPSPPMDGRDSTRSAPVEQAQNIDQMQMRMLAREVAREVIPKVAALMSASGVAGDAGSPLPEDPGSRNPNQDGLPDGISNRSPSPPSYNHHLSSS